VKPDATPEEITRAYRRRRGKVHPDHGGSKEDFRAVQLAYDVLSDPMSAGPGTSAATVMALSLRSGPLRWASSPSS
jgi:hypothetical protein